MKDTWFVLGSSVEYFLQWGCVGVRTSFVTLHSNNCHMSRTVHVEDQVDAVGCPFFYNLFDFLSRA